MGERGNSLCMRYGIRNGVQKGMPGMNAIHAGPFIRGRPLSQYTSFTLDR